MSLTIATVLHAAYDPIQHAVSQHAFFRDLLYHDYYQQDPYDTSKDDALADDRRDLTASNVSLILANTRLVPMRVCTHYLTRPKALYHNIVTYIIPIYVRCNCLHAVNSAVKQLVQSSPIHPLDKAYLTQSYTPYATHDEIAMYLTEVIWYAMQTQRTVHITQAA